MRRTRLALALLSLLVLVPAAMALPPVVIPEPSGNEIEETVQKATSTVGSADGMLVGKVKAATGIANLTANALVENASAVVASAPLPAAPAAPSSPPPALLTVQATLAEEIEGAIALAASAAAGDAPDAAIYAEKRLARLEMRLAALTGG